MGNVHVMSFSPTGGSRKAAMEVGKQIAQSAGCAVGELSLGRPDDRAARYHFGPEDLLVLAYPVYGGRMPALLEETMTHLAGENTPAVVLAVYGNRAYEDALLEGVERLQKQGFVPIAAGAFVAEHTYTSALAGGRPDESDLALARQLGEKAAEKWQKGEKTLVKVPGNHPYKERGAGASRHPKTKDNCTGCGLCASLCPMGIIDPQDPKAVGEGCLACFACVKNCPVGAKFFEDEGLDKAKMWLEANFQEPKTPELFVD